MSGFARSWNNIFVKLFSLLPFVKIESFSHLDLIWMLKYTQNCPEASIWSWTHRNPYLRSLCSLASPQVWDSELQTIKPNEGTLGESLQIAHNSLEAPLWIIPGKVLKIYLEKEDQNYKNEIYVAHGEWWYLVCSLEYFFWEIKHWLLKDLAGQSPLVNLFYKTKT